MAIREYTLECSQCTRRWLLPRQAWLKQVWQPCLTVKEEERIREWQEVHVRAMIVLWKREAERLPEKRRLQHGAVRHAVAYDASRQEIVCASCDRSYTPGYFKEFFGKAPCVKVTAQTWDDDQPIANLPSDWNALGGNSATVSVFDADKRLLYFMAGTQDRAGRLSFDLAAVDVDEASLVAHPPLADVGMAKCTDCVAAMVLA